ncbi:hypothetical protein Hanom_Chr08g00732301 [Helianthus anomalus]
MEKELLCSYVKETVKAAQSVGSWNGFNGLRCHAGDGGSSFFIVIFIIIVVVVITIVC